jgi:hypothetical protein
MQTYEFIFHCEQCAKEIAEIVTSPELLTREELNQLRFRVTCNDQNCGWTGERTGFEAERKKAALKPISVSA